VTTVPWAEPVTTDLGHDRDGHPVVLVVSQTFVPYEVDIRIEVGTDRQLHLYRVPPHLVEDLRAALLPLCPADREAS